MARKTADIKDELAKANEALRRGASHDDPKMNQGWRAGICTSIESTLMDAEQYAGYTFIDEDGNALPNIEQDAPDVGEPGFYRRQYFTSQDLQD